MEDMVNKLRQELDVDINWRISEVSTLKIIPYQSKMSERNREILQKYSIPAFYALWEGFVSSAFETYIKKLNELSLTIGEIHPKIITHDLDIKKGLKDGRVNINKQLEFTLDLMEYFSIGLNIAVKVPTKSNVNYKTINNILERLNLETFEKNIYEYRLVKLLKYRNDIAHGENSLKVDEKIVSELSNTVIICMDRLNDILISGFVNKTYLKSG